MVTARHVLNDKILPVLRRRRKQSLKTKVDLDSNNLTDVNTSVHNNVVSLQQNSFLADGNVIDGKIYITKRHVSSRPKSKLDRNGLHFANTSERFSTPYIVLKYIQAMFVIILLILLALMIVNYGKIMFILYICKMYANQAYGYVNCLRYNLCFTKSTDFIWV